MKQELRTSLTFLKLWPLVALALFLFSGCATTTPSETTKEKTGNSETTKDTEPVATDTANNDASSQEPVPEKKAELPPEKPDKPRKTVFGGSRPVTLKVPAGYNHKEPHTLLVVLHGYGAAGDLQASYLGVLSLLKEKFLIVAPDGTKDSSGKQFWNATDACCNFENKPVDDVKYISGLIADIKKEYNVDPKRVFLLGHSNGGFMSFRMACELSEQLTGSISIAGATFVKSESCSPKGKVNILQIHGTSDATILYKGGKLGGVLAYPSATQTVEMWGSYNQCTGKLDTSNSLTLDVDQRLTGKDTRVNRIAGCPAGGGVELWTIEKGAHIPSFGENFAQLLLKWMKTATP
jgi:polyhydroxybutyrate depolymerase